MFNVYDEVWIMENNKPTKKIVFAVIDSMNDMKNGTERYYHIVDNQVGAGWGNNEGHRYQASDLFADKKAVIKSLSE